MKPFDLIRKQRIMVVCLLAAIAITAFISLGVGYSSVSFDRILPTLLGQGTVKEQFVLFSIRMPKICITLLAGMALALSGSVLQTVTRNALADPGVIGINSGAGVGIAVYVLFFPIDTGNMIYMLPLVAFIGALLTAVLISVVSYSRIHGLITNRLVLVGVGVSIALSGFMIVMVSGAERTKVEFIAKWLAGSIWGDDWAFIGMLLPWLCVLIPFVLYKSRTLNLLGLGEDSAKGLGVPITRERLLMIVIAVAAAAAAVSVTGGIAFVGLLAPHIAKMVTGPRNQLSVPLAVLIGGLLLLAADTVGRNLVDADGVPAGVMISLIGVPYFAYLLIRSGAK